MPNLPPHSPFTRRPVSVDAETHPHTMLIARKPAAVGSRAPKLPRIGPRQRLHLKGSLLVLDAAAKSGSDAPC